MGGKESEKRYKAKQAAKRKVARATAKLHDRLGVQKITENDLLAFQLSHFDDDGKPNTWFVDAQTALGYDPTTDPDLIDDGLGYYEDGMKRTLTDEQIEMFRHSEREELLREQRLQEAPAAEAVQPVETESATHREAIIERGVSPASSIEEELVNVRHTRPVERTTLAQQRRRQSPSIAKLGSKSTDPRTRPRAQETPYDQRHKRKWEAYIDENDPVEGSLTHRRIVREMDEQRDHDVDLDY